MNVTLYSTGCPKCKILEKKLLQKSIDFQVVTDRELMISLGFSTMPVLKVNDKIMNFKEAVNWVNKEDKWN